MIPRQCARCTPTHIVRYVQPNGATIVEYVCADHARQLKRQHGRRATVSELQRTG